MIKLSKNAAEVLEARYLRRGPDGRPAEDADELVNRVAEAVACGELAYGTPSQALRWEDNFRSLLGSLDFLPNSPTLMNAGTPLGQLSACYVLPIEDSTESIFDALKEAALVQRTGGGTGFSFSHLRPRGDILSTGGESSGPVSFVRLFDCATEQIRLGGRRRGANMGVLQVDHPDIREFVAAKEDGVSLRNFNLSVGVTDEFMKAVIAGNGYDLVDPRTGASRVRVSAAGILDAISRAAWQSGDPGLLFLDAIRRGNPTPHLGVIEATNPCGEIPLLPYESCTLGSVNLPHFVIQRGGRAMLDEARLRDVVQIAVRFLDDVLTVNRYPIPKADAMAKANRKIGLGIMGYAEMLIRLGIPYDGDASLATAESLMGTIHSEAIKASAELAAERGVFPNWRGSVWEARGLRVRHAAMTAIAPTGTISILGGTTASIEPLFALAYGRNVLEGRKQFELAPLLQELLSRRGLDSPEITAAVVKTGTLKQMAGVPEDLKHLFVTALDIAPERHLAVQAVFQRHVDNSVSKTVNLPGDARPEDVRDVYLRAWKLGLKGVTVYRYGSKASQVLELGADERAQERDHASRCDPDQCRV